MIKIGEFIKRCTKKVFDVEGKTALISFRILILFFLFFFVLYGRREGAENELWQTFPLQKLLILAAIQFVSNIFLAVAPEKLLRKGLSVWLFFFDIVLVSVALYWTQGFESDLFLIYFLVVFMTVIARKPAVSFLVAALACVLYGFIFLKSQSLSELMQPSIMIRFPLLWVVAFFSSWIAHDAESEKDALKAEMQAHWIHSEKLAALGEMASGIAHEINNPLTSILGTVQLILNESGEGDGIVHKELVISKEDMKVIERNTVRCKKIVSDMLKFSSQHEFCFENMDVKQPLMDAFSLLQNRIKFSKIGVIWKNLNEPVVQKVSASAVHLEQVFFNLIANAVQAMSQGGTLTITIDRKKNVSKRNICSEFIEVMIQDTGIGIDPENMKRLFQPFFTTKGNGQGTGLGLTVAHSIIAKHNGKIFVESKGVHQGTKVVVQLPAALTSELKSFTLPEEKEEVLSSENR